VVGPIVGGVIATAFVEVLLKAQQFEQEVRSEVEAPLKRLGTSAQQAGADVDKGLRTATSSGTLRKLGDDAETAGNRINQGLLKGVSGGVTQLRGALPGVGGALDALGASAGSMSELVATGLAGAGAAFVAFGVKSVASFQESAQEVLHFKEVTGTTADEASRLVAVADDMGVSADDLSRSFGFLARSIATSPQKLEQLGVAIAHTNDGGVDLQNTFVNVIRALDGIQDPTTRAQVAQQAFGRSWQGIVKLIDEGASNIQDALASVPEFQRFNDADLKSSEDFRHSLDDLGDAVTGLERSLGEGLIPVLTDGAKQLTAITEAAIQAADVIGNFRSAVAKRAEKSDFFGDFLKGWRALTGAQLDNSQAAAKQETAQEKLNAAGQAASGLFDGIVAGNIAIAQSSGQVNIALDATTVALGDAGLEASHNLTILAAQTVAYDANTIAAGDAGAAYEKNAAAAKTAAEDQKALGAALVKVNSTWNEQAQAVSALSTVFAVQNETLFGAADAVAGVQDANGKLLESWKKNGVALGALNETGRTNLKLTEDLRNAIGVDLGQALLNAHGNYQAVTDTATKYRTEIEAEGKAAGLTKAQVQSYIAQLGLTPKDVQTLIRMSGQEEAHQKLLLLQGDLSHLTGEQFAQYTLAVDQGDFAKAEALVVKASQPVKVPFGADPTDFANQTGDAKKTAAEPTTSPLLTDTGPYDKDTGFAKQTAAQPATSTFLVDAGPYTSGVRGAKDAAVVAVTSPFHSDTAPYSGTINVAKNAAAASVFSELHGNTDPYDSAVGRAKAAAARSVTSDLNVRVHVDRFKIVPFQHGGPLAAGQVGLVGERGPELFMPGVSGQVISNAQLMTALSGVRGSLGRTVEFNFHGPVSFGSDRNAAVSDLSWFARWRMRTVA
jgi:hypothetical protein